MGRLIRRLVALLFVPALCTLVLARTSIPAGTPVHVRVIDNLSSEKSTAGETFRGTLEAPVTVDGRVVFARGANVEGRVVRVHPSGRLSDPGVLELALVSVGGRSVRVSNVVIKGESHAKNNVTKIGGGAAAGGILGAVFGGGKGAAIGAGAGATGGTVAAAATGKKPAIVESEAVVTWVSEENVAPGRPVVADTRYNRDDSRDTYRAPRYRDDDDEDDDHDDRRRDRDDRDRYYFSDDDRRIISTCFADSRSNLPPGLAKKDRLPPGLERQLQRNGTLPPGLQKRVQPLPHACESRLPRLPRNWSRVVLSGRIMLLDGGSRIVDLFVIANY